MYNRANIGAVIIGRNEGDHLVRSLNSIICEVQHIIYVDSDSSDNSRSMAQELGVEVVALDVSIPFTAARARNAGFEQLYNLNPDIEYVQFVDGDCEVADGWIDAAANILENDQRIGVVCGRRRERHPQNSVYNLLCDMEWDTPIGETKSCGGDFMIRAPLFRDVGKFNASLIAGEEPELCVRIRKNGWMVWRTRDEMTLHDANITRFRQWWKRNVRGGFAFAEGAYLHGHKPERHDVAESIRIWLWGLIIPFSILILAFFEPLFITLLLIYPIQIVRVAIKEKRNLQQNWVYASFVTLGKFPEMQGQLKFWFGKLLNLKSQIIEYKS